MLIGRLVLELKQRTRHSMILNNTQLHITCEHAMTFAMVGRKVSVMTRGGDIVGSQCHDTRWWHHGDAPDTIVNLTKND